MSHNNRLIHTLSSSPTTYGMIDGTVGRVAHALMQTWISYFAVLLRITTDLGEQFDLDLSKKLTDFRGFNH